MKIRKSLRRWAKPLLARAGFSGFYQQKRQSGANDRWGLISACLTSDDRFVLDIGCNIGEFTYNCGQGGRFALGLDISAGAIRMAIARASGVENVAFGVCKLSPDLIGLLPRNDVTLCLSVSHNWHREYGESLTWQMLESLIARSQKFIFEPASIQQKYGQYHPDFTDNNIESICSYYLPRLQKAAGPGGSARLIGKTECLGREPYRYMFLVETSKPSTQN